MTPAATTDPRISAFCKPGSDVFHARVALTEIWKDDPFDVESIHDPTRSVFRSLLRDCLDAPEQSGRILTIIGESGAGKTHLMRYFRNHVHNTASGYCAYLQVTSSPEDYSQYVLSNIIDSLQAPYTASYPDTGWIRLSNDILEKTGLMRKFIRDHQDNQRATFAEAIREWNLPPGRLGKLIKIALKFIFKQPEYQLVNPSILAALLYLQTSEPHLKGAAMEFMRTGKVPPVFNADMPILPPELNLSPIQTIQQLALVMRAARNQPLVICVDQIESLLNRKDKDEIAVRLIDALVNIADAVPGSLTILSCLDAFYTEIKSFLTRPLQAKIEIPPSPCSVAATIETQDQITELVRKRLDVLYESQDVEIDIEQPTFPIPMDNLHQHGINLRARRILMLCAAFRQEAIRSGEIPESFPVEGAAGDDREKLKRGECIEQIEADWISFLARQPDAVTQDESRLTDILAATLESAAFEISRPLSMQPGRTGSDIVFSLNAEPFRLAVCNKGAAGGGLMHQLAKLAARSNNERLIVVRSGEFPKSSSSKTNVFMAKLMRDRRARRVTMQTVEWKSLAAYPAFANQFRKDPAVDEWRWTMRPLMRKAGVQQIFGLSPIDLVVGGNDTVNLPDPEQTQPGGQDNDPVIISPDPTRNVPLTDPVPKQEGGILLGRTTGIVPKPVSMPAAQLVRHAAFLGGTGSGKTTLAMNVVEQLLAAGIPVLLVDRKGDLCSYALGSAWGRDLESDHQRQRRERLRNNVDVQLFTPGDPRGRPLSFAIMPDGSHLLGETERRQISRRAADGLAPMIGLKRNDRTSLGILHHAIFTLTEINDPQEVLLDEIIDLVENKDDQLIVQLGVMPDDKFFKKLLQGLVQLKVNYRDHFEESGERVNAELLFGLGRFRQPGRTRLSIISTRFLTDRILAECFVAQLLLELQRWFYLHPSNSLQAAVLFDEADVYLPAVGKPATKEPLEDLLRRARSAGLGVFLVTQSPGDFDYRCRENINSWFLGRIKEDTALKKLRPLLAEDPSVLQRLGGQSIGQFHIVRSGGDIQRIQADRNIVQLNQIAEPQILKLSQNKL